MHSQHGSDDHSMTTPDTALYHHEQPSVCTRTSNTNTVFNCIRLLDRKQVKAVRSRSNQSNQSTKDKQGPLLSARSSLVRRRRSAVCPFPAVLPSAFVHFRFPWVVLLPLREAFSCFHGSPSIRPPSSERSRPWSTGPSFSLNSASNSVIRSATTHILRLTSQQRDVDCTTRLGGQDLRGPCVQRPRQYITLLPGHSTAIFTPPPRLALCILHRPAQT
jgi:hypothetical protein